MELIMGISLKIIKITSGKTKLYTSLMELFIY